MPDCLCSSRFDSSRLAGIAPRPRLPSPRFTGADSALPFAAGESDGDMDRAYEAPCLARSSYPSTWLRLSATPPSDVGGRGAGDVAAGGAANPRMRRLKTSAPSGGVNVPLGVRPVTAVVPLGFPQILLL